MVDAFTAPSSVKWDVFACKLNSAGALQWNTFMGSSGDDQAGGIAVDSSGNVYVTGYSFATWGTTPKTAFAGNADAFAIKLNSSGARQWHTFMGSANNDYGHDIEADSSGNVYVAGYSYASWGANIISGYTAASADAFAAKLNSSGTLQWSTFLGSSGDDFGNELVLDSSGNIFLVGSSKNSWDYGSTAPLTAHAGGTQDAFVLQMDNSGVVQWHTFLGGTGSDSGNGIALDSCGSVYVAGSSNATWGSPPAASAYAGDFDAFAAMLGSATASTCYSGSSGGSTSTSGGGSSSPDPDTISGSTTVQGTAANKTITAGANVTIDSTGSTTNTTVAGGAAVTNQGSMTGTTVQSGATVTNGGGTMTDTTVETGGTVANSGTMTGTTVQAGGTVTNDGGTMTDTTVESGAAVDNTGGQIQDITLGSGAEVSGGNITGDVTAGDGAQIRNTVLADNAGFTCPEMAASATLASTGDATLSFYNKWTGQTFTLQLTQADVVKPWKDRNPELTLLADGNLQIVFNDTGETLLVPPFTGTTNIWIVEYTHPDPAVYFHYGMTIDLADASKIFFIDALTDETFSLPYTKEEILPPKRPEADVPEVMPDGNDQPACPASLKALAAGAADPNQAPGTTITGGILQGHIVGDPYNPALINAQIGDSAVLSHVIIGKDSTVSTSATLGYGVKFEEDSQIPAWTDLTPLTALANDSMAALHISVALDLGGEIIYGSGTSLMDDMNALPDLALNGLTLFQDTATGTVDLYTPDMQISLQPTAVWQLKTGDTPPGVYLLDDGTVNAITFDDRMIVLTPMIQQPSKFYDLMISHGANASGVSFTSGVITALLDFASFMCLKSKPDSVSTLVKQQDPGTSTGTPYFKLTPFTDVPNVDLVSLVFSEKGGLWEQKLYPAPADWAPLKTALSMMPGVTEKITIRHDGTVETTVNGKSFKGLLSYFTHGGTNPSGKMQILPLADQNNDGTTDLKLIYPDGTWQIMYRF